MLRGGIHMKQINKLLSKKGFTWPIAIIPVIIITTIVIIYILRHLGYIQF